MKKIDQLDSLAKKLQITLLAERRQDLCTLMSSLEQIGIDCQNCSGICCSYIANSMQTTPLEALEIILYLHEKSQLTENLISSLSQTVQDYRLDYHLDAGSGTSFRRTYNCPFYTPGSKGCSLSRKVKPLGCLAFNPGRPLTKEGESCAPGFAQLKEIDKNWGERIDGVNHELRQSLDLHWDKLPMPLAILELLK